MRAAGRALTVGELVEALAGVDPLTPVETCGTEAAEVTVRAAAVEIDMGADFAEEVKDAEGLRDELAALLVKLVACKSIGPVRKAVREFAGSQGFNLEEQAAPVSSDAGQNVQGG